jgi:hypothetical protein
MKPFREQRAEATKQMVGAHYGEDGAGDKVPVNLLELACNVYTRQLAARAPKAIVSTKYKELKGPASMLELAVNHLVGVIELERTLRRAALEALFGIGCVKCGITPLGGLAHGILNDPGQPFAEVVTLDDLVLDMAALTIEEMQYCGNLFRLPYEQVMESEFYLPEGKAKLKPTRKQPYHPDGDERLETLSQGFGTDRDEYRDMVELQEIWLPLEGLLVTLPAEGEGPPLRVVEWNGPRPGPFHFLGFSEVPGQLMPLAPTSLWLDLHELVNRLFRKLGRQAERQKDVTLYRGAAAEDAERVRDAEDGGLIRVDDPQGVQVAKYGGIDQANFALTIHLKDLFTYLAGNIDAIGGLGPQSGTLGQDQLISENASKRVADMQDRTVRFAKEVIHDLAYYLWTDPLIRLPLVKQIKEANVELNVEFTPSERQGEYMDYNITIDPYSMAHQSPAVRLQTLMQIWSNFIGPFAPQLGEQGMQVNFEALLRIVAKLANFDELDELITFANAPPATPVDVPERHERTMPANTTRTNVRVNRPGATTGGKDMALVSSLLSRVQPKEAASILRPTG